MAHTPEPGVSSGIFSPALAGVGIHTITYSYQHPLTGCIGRTSQNIVVAACTEIEEAVIERSIALFPNPVNDFLIIDIENITEPLQLELINPLGYIIYSGYLDNRSQNFLYTVDVSQFTPGLYFVRITGNFTNQLEKVVIE